MQKWHVHLEQEIHSVVQVALLEGNADRDAGVGVDGSTLSVADGGGISSLVDNQRNSRRSHGGGGENKDGQLHDGLMLACIELVMNSWRVTAA